MCISAWVFGVYSCPVGLLSSFHWLHCCQELKCLSWQGSKNGWELLQSAYADDAAENEEDLQGEDEDENSEDEDENNEGDVGMRPPPGQEREHHEMAGGADESQSEATDPAETQICLFSADVFLCMYIYIYRRFSQGTDDRCFGK